MKLKHFIKINSKEMNKETRAIFYSLVKDSLGDLVGVIKSTDQEGNPTTTKMFHKVVDGEHWYIVPLKECPTEEQVDSLVEKLVSNLNMGDFQIESSLSVNKDIFDNSISENDFGMIAEKFAQKMHQDWLEQRRTNGWRYGDRRDDEAKTHPLVREWNQLSESEKGVKPELVREFVDILKSNGFKIIKK